MTSFHFLLVHKQGQKFRGILQRHQPWTQLALRSDGQQAAPLRFNRDLNPLILRAEQLNIHQCGDRRFVVEKKDSQCGRSIKEWCFCLVYVHQKVLRRIWTIVKWLQWIWYIGKMKTKTELITLTGNLSWLYTSDIKRLWLRVFLIFMIRTMAASIWYWRSWKTRSVVLACSSTWRKKDKIIIKYSHQ